MSESVHPSQCWECNTYCGSLITMRDGQVTKIGPNPDHPGSKGAFCVKGIRAVREWTDNENRLLYPMRRVGARGSGEWERISWDDALDEIADRIAAIRTEYGPMSIAGAVSGAAFSRGAVMALLMRSIGSPNRMINQDLCGGCQALSEKLTGVPMKIRGRYRQYEMRDACGTQSVCSGPHAMAGPKVAQEARRANSRDRSGHRAGKRPGGHMAAPKTRHGRCTGIVDGASFG